MNVAEDAALTSIQVGRYFGYKKHNSEPVKDVKIVTPYENLHLKADDDRDGIINRLDQCPHSIRGAEVDQTGCCTETAECHRVR